MSEFMNVLQTMPAYLISLFKNHTLIMVLIAVIFLFVTLFSGKAATKIRSIFVLVALLLVVFSFISQSWPRIALICIGLLLMLACRIFGYVISEIRITRRNRRLEERALEKAAKRRGSWQNKKGYSGARKPIIEPEYIPEAMNSEEIADVIENEISDADKTEATASIEDAMEDTFDTEDVIIEDLDDFDDLDDSDWSDLDTDDMADDSDHPSYT